MKKKSKSKSITNRNLVSNNAPSVEDDNAFVLRNEQTTDSRRSSTFSIKASPFVNDNDDDDDEDDDDEVRSSMSPTTTRCELSSSTSTKRKCKSFKTNFLKKQDILYLVQTLLFVDSLETVALYYDIFFLKKKKKFSHNISYVSSNRVMLLLNSSSYSSSSTDARNICL